MPAASATTLKRDDEDSRQPSPVGPSSGPDKADALIQSRIAEARHALWIAELVRASLRWVIAALLVLFIWIVVDQWVYSAGPLPRIVFASGVLSVSVWYLWRYVRPLIGSTIRPEYAARAIERDLPELRQELTSYITLKPSAGQHTHRSETAQAGLASRVVRSMGAQAAGRLKSHDALPTEATGTLRLWVAAAAALAILILYATLTPKNPIQSVGRLIAPWAKIDPPRRVSIKEVEPGDADARAGRDVGVSARIDGLRDDERVFCRWKSIDREFESELLLDPSTQRFIGEISLSHAASGQVNYEIIAGDAKAGPFHLLVEDVPVVAVDSVYHDPPKYTATQPHTSRSGAITAVDGTRVTVRSSTNRLIKRATIEFNPRPIGDSIQATAGATEMSIAEDGRSQSITFPLRSAAGRSAAVQLDGYRIRVWDDSGQDNPEPIIYPVRVIPDFAPEVAIVMPQKSPKNVPINASRSSKSMRRIPISDCDE